MLITQINMSWKITSNTSEHQAAIRRHLRPGTDAGVCKRVSRKRSLTATRPIKVGTITPEAFSLTRAHLLTVPPHLAVARRRSSRSRMMDYRGKSAGGRPGVSGRARSD